MPQFSLCYPAVGLSWVFSLFYRLPGQLFIPGISGSHKYRLALLFWGRSSSHVCTRSTARRICSAHLHMDVWACVPGLPADGCSLPWCTWRRPCLGKSSSSAQLGASGVCKGHECCQGSLRIKRLHPLVRCHSPQSVTGAQLASPGRGAKEELHWCKREMARSGLTRRNCGCISLWKWNKQQQTSLPPPQSKSCLLRGN